MKTAVIITAEPAFYRKYICLFANLFRLHCMIFEMPVVTGKQRFLLLAQLVPRRPHIMQRCLSMANACTIAECEGCMFLQGLIAGGTYTGDVYVWDLSQEGDSQVFKSTLNASSHQ